MELKNPNLSQIRQSHALANRKLEREDTKLQELVKVEKVQSK